MLQQRSSECLGAPVRDNRPTMEVFGVCQCLHKLKLALEPASVLHSRRRPFTPKMPASAFSLVASHVAEHAYCAPAARLGCYLVVCSRCRYSHDDDECLEGLSTHPRGRVCLTSWASSFARHHHPKHREFMHLLSPTMFWTFVDQCDLPLGASDQGDGSIYR